MHNAASNSILHKSRRPSKLGDNLVKQKIEQARKLPPEQRLLMALELSNAAAAFQRACLKQP